MSQSTLALAATVVSLLAMSCSPASSNKQDLEIAIHSVDADGVGAELGTIGVEETEYGLVFSPDHAGLAPGWHGFHVHQNASCEPAERDGKMVPALSAGGHYDPRQTGKHGKPWGDGHLGDLPAMYVDEDGNAQRQVLAPRVTVDDLAGRAFVIHAGGDNYSDDPAPLGGGGARIACGTN